MDMWTGEDSGTNLVSDSGMSKRRPMGVHWTGRLDRTVGQSEGGMFIAQVDWTGQWDKPGGMSNKRPVDIHWTGGLDRTVGQARSVRVGHLLDRWTGQDSGTNLVCEGGMSNGRPMDVHWTCGLDRAVGQARSVRVGCPTDVPWTSIGLVDWKGQ